MIRFENLFNNQNMREIACRDGVRVYEHQKDLSAGYANATTEYYASQMNIRKRQVLIELNGNAFVLSAGGMQWMSGGIEVVSDIKGVGDFIGKAISSKVTKESAIKPK